jgi:hypothetical protein
MSQKILANCKILLAAYKDGILGQTRMPEDSHPEFLAIEERLTYFTLPMALNYQRDSYKLWEAALKAYNDPKTNDIFSIKAVSEMNVDELRKKLLKHKVALQPNKHTLTWKSIADTVSAEWGSLEAFFSAHDNDFVAIRQTLQVDRKKGFPYLSGPKIFNYWSFIMSTYGGVKLKNRSQIGIAPDTHITKCSVLLGVITSTEAETLTKDVISERWIDILKGTGIDPIDMHPPLWFWSRNNFIFKLP